MSGYQCSKCKQDVRFCHGLCGTEQVSKRAKRSEVKNLLLLSSWTSPLFNEARKLSLEIANLAIIKQVFLKWYNQKTGETMTAAELTDKVCALGVPAQRLLVMMEG